MNDDIIHHRCAPLQANLAGLQGNLNFQLLKLKGCRIKVHVECLDSDMVITGRICNVGTNFLSIYIDEGHPAEKVVTVMSDRICLIEWHDKNCSPCRAWESCNSFD